MKDLLVVSEINQILFQSKLYSSQRIIKTAQEYLEKVMLWPISLGLWVLAVKQMLFIRILKIRGAIGEAGQKDKLTYVILLKQVEEKTRAFLTKCNYKGYYSKIISSKCFGNHWQLDFRQINKVSPIAFWWKKYIRPQPAADSANPQSVS